MLRVSTARGVVASTTVAANAVTRMPAWDTETPRPRAMSGSRPAGRNSPVIETKMAPARGTRPSIGTRSDGACIAPPSLAAAACPLRCVPVAPSDPLQTDDVTGRPRHWVLSLVCRDEPGIVHAISGAIVAARGNITESQQFSSADTGRFFMRLQVESEAGRGECERALAPVVEKFGMTHRVDNVGRPLRTLVLVSKAAHCLNDLLFRQRAGQLPVEIPLVLSNHDTLSDLA